MMIENLFPKDEAIFKKKYSELMEHIPSPPIEGYQFGSICSGSLKWHDNEIVRKAIALRAWIFAALTRSVVGKYGKEGEELIKKTQWDLGIEQSKRWARFGGIKIGELGVKELPAIIGAGAEITFPWAPVTILKPNEKECVIRTLVCSLAEAWMAINFPPDMCKLYCDTDFALFTGLNPKFDCKRTKYIPNGDSYCEYIIGYS